MVALVLAFGACDAVASLIGMLAGRTLLDVVEPHLRVAGALVVAAYGLALLRTVERESPRTDRMALSVPVALSLDNLGAGAALAGGGFHALAWALMLGGASMLLAAAGFAAGRVAAARAPTFVPRVAGVLVMGLAVLAVTGRA